MKNTISRNSWILGGEDWIVHTILFAQVAWQGPCAMHGNMVGVVVAYVEKRCCR